MFREQSDDGLEDRSPGGRSAGSSSARFTERDEEAVAGWRHLFKPPRVESTERRREAVRLAAVPVLAGLAIGLLVFEVALLMYYGTVWKSSAKNFEVLIYQSDAGIVVPALSQLPGLLASALTELNTTWYANNQTLPLLSQLPGRPGQPLPPLNFTGLTINGIVGDIVARLAPLLGSLSLPNANTSVTINIGQTVTDAITSFRNPLDGTPLGDFTIRTTPGVEHLNACSSRVRSEEFWVCLQFPANYTLNILRAFVSLPNRTYVNAIDAFINTGHHPATSTVITNGYKNLIVGINQAFATQLVTGLSRVGYPLNLAAPGVLIRPVYLDVHDEFYVPGSSNYFIAVFLVLGWGAVVSSIAVLYASTEKLYHYFAPFRVFLLRMVTVFFFVVALSLTWTITIYAFGVPNIATNFGAIWWWGCYSLTTFASVIFFLTSLLGPLAAVFLTPLMVLMLNLSNAYFDTVVSRSDFYHWGVALPWYNAYQGFRTLFFGTPGNARLAFNGGILAIWFFSFLFLTWMLFLFRTLERAQKFSGPDTPIGRLFAGFQLGTVATNNSVLAGGLGVSIS